MTAQTKPILKGYFNAGDMPTEANFINLIDTIGQSTLLIAANDASDASKGRADYVCDGVADQTEINAAVGTLPVAGGTIWLSEGTFVISDTVVIDRSRVTLRGMGLYATIIKAATGSDPDPLVAFGEAAIVHRCSIKDLWIYGNNDADPGQTGDGLIFHVNGGSLDDVNVTWVGGDGVVVNGAAATEIYETFITNLTIYFPGNDGLVVGTLCYDSVFTRVMVKGGGQEVAPFGRYGILYSGESCIFNNCHPYFNVKHGFYADGNSDSVFINGGHFETNTENGILLYLVLQGSIIGVWCYANVLNDIQLSWCENILVTSSVCKSSSGNSIGMYEVDTSIISDNSLKNATSMGIWMDANSDGNIISGNQVLTAGGSTSAIGINASDNNWILDNKVNDTIDQTGGSAGNVIRTP